MLEQYTSRQGNPLSLTFEMGSIKFFLCARVAELVDALDLGSSGRTRASSNLASRTIKKGLSEVTPSTMMHSLSETHPDEEQEMKIKVEDIDPVQKKVLIEVPVEQVMLEFDKAYKKIGQHVKIKGFRKGKAPRSLIRRYHGDSVREEVLEGLIRKTFPKVLKDLDAKLATEPMLEDVGELKEGEPFSYSALLNFWPEFDLPEYKGLRLERAKVMVTEEEVEEQMQALRKHFGFVESLEEDRPVQEGDIVILDFQGSFNGEPVEGLKEENYYIEVGTGYFNEKFEKGLIGAEKGAERVIEVDYPEDALNENVAGKTIQYTVLVKDIKKRVLPDLDDEFAKKIGPQYNTIDTLRERMRKQLEEDKKEAADRALRQQLIDKLIEQVDFPLPKALVDKKLTQMMDNIVAHLQERGMDLEGTGMSEERLKEKMRPDAERQVKMEMILDEIAEKEGISVSNEDLVRYTEALPQYKDLDQTQVRSAVIDYVLPKLRAKNTIDFLLEHADIETVKEDMVLSDQ